MNFQQLTYIIAVDKYKHFAQAADNCHITQATLSAMIKKLEQELGLVLFDRTRQPVKTTDEGLQVIELAKKILFHQQEMLDLNQTTVSEISGELRLGIIPTVANSLLPLILPSLLHDFPALHLKIVEVTTEELKQQLISEKVDIGIMATPLEDEMLEENILYYEAMMVYGISGDKKYITPKEIQNQRIWLLEEGNCFRNQSATICNIKEKSKAPSNLSFEGSSFDTLLNLTDRFGGYTLVPELYYNLMPEEKKKKTKNFELPIPVREISLVYHRPYAKKRSIDLLSEHIKKLVKGQLMTEKYPAKDLAIIGI
ncbi:LysR substrate-binding domain-containing protein [Flammeovirgaceae bacterium SG7u.111]|nr:LysR substrate-binding domain-containing protein [Flammeovirgaceae bacterium SG7u.132]WPO36583.1 LysR substrate-binding domain-containing protein [Flammeovirgaceae bacterium SG7u.111]